MLYLYVKISKNSRKEYKELAAKRAKFDDIDDFDFESDKISAKICFINYNSREKQVFFKISQIEDPGFG